jgi:cation diffusion facilitator CzcD-associated flavoprotein CzcO
VVGAGIGGMYAVHQFRGQGLNVVGLESAGGFGGVWYHNRYPGARVDIQSLDYCYFFSPEVYRTWQWSERYASQPELLAYVNYVAELYDIKANYLFNTRMTGANWKSDARRWEIETEPGLRYAARFLVMATGNLSAARKPDFPGLDDFKGEWVQTSHWPHRPVQIEGRRIGVIGTGSSGVQTVPVVAETAAMVHVFQRSPNFAVPAQNRPLDQTHFARVRDRVAETRAELLNTRSGSSRRAGIVPRPAAECPRAEQLALLEAQWEYGGQGMNYVFSDQGTNEASNEIVANFVRDKIRQIVKDPTVAELLCPYDHPIGTRRLCQAIGYHEAFNRDNVQLVDIRSDPIECFTPTGIETRSNHYELDLVIFALGFQAFTGAINKANIRNEAGESPTDGWSSGPRTYLGLMTTGFPNFFMLTGPGSPSVLANMMVGNEQHVEWISDCLAYMQTSGYTRIEPSREAQDEWTRHVAEVSTPLLRRVVRNYMAYVNPFDQSQVFIPYAGGLDQYVRKAAESAKNGYPGVLFE